MSTFYFCNNIIQCPIHQTIIASSKWAFILIKNIGKWLELKYLVDDTKFVIDSLCFSIHPVCLIWDFYILVYSHLFSAWKCISVLTLMLLTRSCPCATKMQKQNPFCGKHSIQSHRNLGTRGHLPNQIFADHSTPSIRDGVLRSGMLLYLHLILK